MSDPTRNAICSLYNHFKLYPNSIYTWVNSSPVRKKICQDRHIKASFLQYDICCNLIFTLFQENKKNYQNTYYSGIARLLIDLKKLKTLAILCEIYLDNQLAHVFIIQKTAESSFYLYQSHPNYYNLFESLEKLDKEPVSFEHLKTHLTYLEKNYSQSNSKHLFHFPLRTGQLSLIYKRCRYLPVCKLDLPAPPNQTQNLFIIFIFVITIIAVISYINDSRFRIRK